MMGWDGMGWDGMGWDGMGWDHLLGEGQLVGTDGRHAAAACGGRGGAQPCGEPSATGRPHLRTQLARRPKGDQNGL